MTTRLKTRLGRPREYDRRSVCFRCGKVFERYPGKQKNKRTFCSRKCYNAQLGEDNLTRRVNQKGGLTVEERKKIGDSRRGKHNGRTYEKYLGQHKHRIIMADMIGRPLKPKEIVHHIDGDVRNNNPKNLMLFPSQAEHLEWHRVNDPRYRGGGQFRG